VGLRNLCVQRRARMSKGKSVSGEIHARREADNGRVVGRLTWSPLREVMSKGESVSRETLLWGDPTCTGFLGDLDGLLGW
jgi:hypothetical protein